ncbi:MAG: ATP-binding protein [Candidatus Eisenbacteria sp.]|nr:ATP-binding protein [Candidatus Eisenbacteria bacterium]
MIRRQTTQLVHDLASQFPAVLILGPRQCGKTTLAKEMLTGEYFDLEKPSDRQVFDGDPELALRRFPAPLIIDEAQTLPDLFPVLRALIDEDRRHVGRFFLLGSVNPFLLEKVSESLAGRVGIVELTPFLFSEVAAHDIALNTLWLRGGMPDACLAAGTAQWRRWQENYLRTFVERDIPRQRAGISPVQMRRLIGLVAHRHGGLLNLSELARALGVSYHTVREHLDVLEAHFIIRRLPPYFPNVGKRLVKSPKLYLRDCGVLHHLLGIDSERALLGSPYCGRSWEGLMTEQLITREQLADPAVECYHYRTHAGAEIDLVLKRGPERVGYEFKSSLSVSKRAWSTLAQAVVEQVIDRGVVVYAGTRRFQPAQSVEVLPAADLLG